MLLAASRTLLDEQGPAGLSLREVARRTGCTHQAPYHHFADRESILAALVEQGFEALAQRLLHANDEADQCESQDRDGTGGVRTALLACGGAYVSFALERPGVFRVMFRPDQCDPARFPSVRAAGERAHAQLLRLAARLGAGGDTVAVDATLLWAHVHGLACLLIDGPLGATLASTAQRDAHLSAVQQRFAEGVLAAIRRP